jgi:hypothetical protein
LFFCCGAGGSRTLVQTRSRSAFYMFITLLIVGIITGKVPSYRILISKSFAQTPELCLNYFCIYDTSGGTPQKKVSREAATA